MRGKEMTRQTLWLEKATVETLKQMGEREDRSVGYLIRRAVQQFVEQSQRAKPAIATGRYMRTQKQEEQKH